MSGDATSLDRLHDVMTPSPAPWWPPAPGWYWLIGALLVVGVYTAVRGVIHWQRNRYRREALAEWRRHEGRLSSPETRITAIAQLAELLKRAAVSAFPREQVASLTGNAWLDFLDRSAAMSGFRSDVGTLLERASYGVTSEIDETEARESAVLVRQWIERHRVTNAAVEGEQC